MNKKKIINDPVHGFITIQTDLIFDVISHPYFQRLRRIKQLGLTEFVYPGAIHTRFHHALGAMHLMDLTLQLLRSKGIEISDKEYEAALLAILLHDIGHGPFSHALEKAILQNTPHEQVSLLLMQKMNAVLGFQLNLAIEIFAGKYHRPFFNQLVSGQLDIDRLDYLRRDCFFTGVSEGNIGASRIIKMFNVRNENLVLEEKGIYSIEHFLNARRLMYWQVYLHKTTVATEQMLINVLRRGRHLVLQDDDTDLPFALKCFLSHEVDTEKLNSEPTFLENFVMLDDTDIWIAMKNWARNKDTIIAMLSHSILNRQIFKINISHTPFTRDSIHKKQEQIGNAFGLQTDEINYMFCAGELTNAAYLAKSEGIKVLKNNGEIVDATQVSDLIHLQATQLPVTKYFVCHAKYNI